MDNEILNKNCTILIIDDSRLNRKVVQRTLEEYGMTIDEASDGVEGLEMVTRKKYDLILLDIVMPRMDGFGFLQAFKALPGMGFIPVILMTGLDDLNSKIMGLTSGADDFLLKPLNARELHARVLSLLRLKKAHDELVEKDRLFDLELTAARRIQQYVIPQAFPHIERPVIASRYLPIEQIGGDFYDVIKLDDKRYGFLIADVTGHGIPAALVMSMTSILFRFQAPLHKIPSELFHIINTQARSILMDSQYITAFYLIFDMEDHTLSFSNAGHTRALYYRRSREKVLLLDTEGLFLGITDVPTHRDKTVRVDQGDRLILYTDGIVEHKNSDGIDFGEKGLARCVREYIDLQAHDFCDRLLAELDRHAPLYLRSDDIAFLCIDF